MKKIAFWSIGTVFALIVFLLAKLPAAHVVYRLPLQNNILVGKVSGSIWNGKIDRVSVNGFVVDKVNWELSAFPLLIGKLSLNVKGGNIRDANAIAVSGPISTSLFNLAHVEAQNLSLYLPSERLIAKAKLPIKLSMGGRFKLRFKDLEYGPNCEALEGTAEWLNANVALPSGTTTLGNFAADLACKDDGVVMSLAEPNTLGLSFESEFSSDFKKFNVSGKFKPDLNLPAEIHQAGNFFGEPERDGYTRFEL
ncbi:type II secretion system protein N [Alteromonas sp. 5E99-2]|uniref:type II secretion system protein N n=1 Tax=Alteromonas sp. 5E99-2 TaxID=2817683 RepID=UPI001A97F1B8|nr:type II secretion system protein N [Alteromonas sp. 5E99-2]MBO1256837.1 type II secretion system protein N [Alteromonas sp. 5E99-2]